jgi:hypothetical protein
MAYPLRRTAPLCEPGVAQGKSTLGYVVHLAGRSLLVQSGGPGSQTRLTPPLLTTPVFVRLRFRYVLVVAPFRSTSRDWATGVYRVPFYLLVHSMLVSQYSASSQLGLTQSIGKYNISWKPAHSCRFYSNSVRLYQFALLEVQD